MCPAWPQTSLKLTAQTLKALLQRNSLQECGVRDKSMPSWISWAPPSVQYMGLYVTFAARDSVICNIQIILIALEAPPPSLPAPGTDPSSVEAPPPDLPPLLDQPLRCMVERLSFLKVDVPQDLLTSLMHGSVSTVRISVEWCNPSHLS